MTKEAIITAAEESFNAFTLYCDGITDTAFFDKPIAKWSIAENVQHLIIATKMSNLAFTLPKFIVRWVAGKPNRPSRSYEELVTKYKGKLQQGGKATGRFVPKPISIKWGKAKLMAQWQKVTIDHLAALQMNRTENDLNNYLVKHPLLGRITLRELCYFTIYHTQHHLHIISQREQPQL